MKFPIALLSILALTACASQGPRDLDRYRLKKLDAFCTAPRAELAVIDGITLKGGERFTRAYFIDGSRIGHSGTGPYDRDRLLSASTGPESRSFQPGIVRLVVEAGDRHLSASIVLKPDTRTLVLFSDKPIPFLSLGDRLTIEDNAGLHAAIIDEAALFSPGARDELCLGAGEPALKRPANQ